ncbi:hypothetical protein KQX54_013272 [Cotesia glomerata]|uniref:Uncharacterized protein n=1 Tax=Cotesia glomerata TaxID=32391 RepID=A0AAV7I072_COTGL|nr:hypothetical protein KQX54_013272 [Cotesia glomerata]
MDRGRSDRDYDYERFRRRILCLKRELNNYRSRRNRKHQETTMTEAGPRAIENREVDQEIVFAWEIKGLLFTCTITRSSCNDLPKQNAESGKHSDPVSDSGKEKEGGGQNSQTAVAAQSTQLDESISKAIGKRLDPDNATGPPIEQEIALRWT